MSDTRYIMQAALDELKLWRMLVNEGGVPRYTVTPGAALNTVVTSTDNLLLFAEAEFRKDEQL